MCGMRRGCVRVAGNHSVLKVGPDTEKLNAFVLFKRPAGPPHHGSDHVLGTRRVDALPL